MEKWPRVFSLVLFIFIRLLEHSRTRAQRDHGTSLASRQLSFMSLTTVTCRAVHLSTAVQRKEKKTTTNTNNRVKNRTKPVTTKYTRVT